MAGVGPPVPQPPPAVPPAPPAQPVVPSPQPGPLPQLNWSYFKAKFAGKPDKDPEAHLL